MPVRSGYCETEWLSIVRDSLLDRGMDENAMEENVLARKGGKAFPLSEHLQGLVYSLLSNQRP